MGEVIHLPLPDAPFDTVETSPPRLVATIRSFNSRFEAETVAELVAPHLHDPLLVVVVRRRRLLRELFELAVAETDVARARAVLELAGASSSRVRW